MPKREPGTPEEKFWKRVSRSGPDECWGWTGSLLPSGYAMFWPDGKAGGKWYAHIYSYVLHGGVIPEGWHVDHVKAKGCVSKCCTNPAHLEAVTPAANSRRIRGNCAPDGSAWVCPRGHVGHVGVKNTTRQGPTHYCRICINQYKRKWRAERKVAGLPRV